MNKEFLQAVHKRLLEIKNKVNFNKNKAICFNLLNYTYRNKLFKPTFIMAHKWLRAQFALWPECHRHLDNTKNIVFPVGHMNEFDKESFNGTLWNNPKRLELLDFLINQAKAQLKEINKE